MIELLKAGVFDSQLIFNNTDKTPDRITEYYELELYISGKGTSHINSSSFPHERGNLIFARPGVARYSENMFSCFYIHFNADSDTTSLLNDIPSVTKVTNYHEYENIYIEIIKIYESEEDKKQFIMQSLIYKILHLLSNQNNFSAATKPSTKISSEIIKNSISYIESNFDKQLSLKDIALYANYSPIYFHKAFTEYVGKTPHDYLLEKRLETAKIYLLATDYAMSAIVDMCGFSSLSYFDYTFKNAYGITPTDFRKRKYSL